MRGGSGMGLERSLILFSKGGKKRENFRSSYDPLKICGFKGFSPHAHEYIHESTGNPTGGNNYPLSVHNETAVLVFQPCKPV